MAALRWLHSAWTYVQAMPPTYRNYAYQLISKKIFEDPSFELVLLKNACTVKYCKKNANIGRHVLNEKEFEPLFKQLHTLCITHAWKVKAPNKIDFDA